MTTYAPIQPRPILCKPSATTNNIQPSSMYLVQSQTPMDTNFHQSNNDFTLNNPVQTSSCPQTSSTPSDEFLRRLRDFHRGRQTPFRILPTIAGQVVDLHLLYNSVVNHGGWEKVTDRQLWPTIASNFSIDSACLNGTQALKNIYIRYLYAFEKITNGENIDSREDENEDSKRRIVSQLQRVPQSYNHLQHSVSDSSRNQYGLFNEFVHRTEYEKLELALLCGFPNELTFTLNTLLLLSSSSNHSKSFDLYKCPRLLDLLFRHIGLSLPTDTLISDHYLKVLYDNIWSKHLNYHMDLFWTQSCSPKILKVLLDIDVDNKKASAYKNFNLIPIENYQEQEFRVEQILMIIRNFSFDRVNAIYLLDTLQSSLSLTYIFLLLISHCEKKIELQKYAYDIWANLALYMHIPTISNDEGLLFRQLLNSMLNGDDEQQQQQDRFKIIRALEIISNLARAGSDNGLYLVDYVDTIVKSLIHISDILVLVHSLECLYQLTELGEQLCDTMLNVQSSTSIITTLIDLLTIEARSFSTDTIKTIKIIEMSSGPVLLPSYHQPPPPPPQVLTPQSVVFLPSNQQMQQQSHQMYPIDNSDLNKNPPRFIIQQNTRPITLASLMSSGSVLSISTAPTQNPTAFISNANIQNYDKKRKLDHLTETVNHLNNEASSPSKLFCPTSSKIPANIGLSSNEDAENSHVRSAITDLLDRCSSSLSFDNDIRSCLHDLCQRVVSIVDQSSLLDINSQLTSPIFKRKIELQTKTLEQIPKAKSSIENSLNMVAFPEKKDEILEQELSSVKSMNVISAPCDYICDWDNCRAAFPTARAAFHHTCSTHVKHSMDYVCLWNGCDRIKRQKWSLISHIQERHCSEIAFRQAKLKLTNSIPTTSAITTNISTNSNRILTSGPVGYAPDAAWFAIRRYLHTNSFDEQSKKGKEGPLTKSIRLTAALILRNIARYSTIGKQNLRQHEQIIANLALEASEASQTLSSCLFELYH